MYYAKAKREPATSTKINCTIKGGKLCKQPTKRAAPQEALPTPCAARAALLHSHSGKKFA